MQSFCVVIEFLKLPDNSFIVKPGVSVTLPCSAVVGSDVLEWFYTENESQHSIWNSQNKSLSEPGSVNKFLKSLVVVDATNALISVDAARDVLFLAKVLFIKYGCTVAVSCKMP